MPLVGRGLRRFGAAGALHPTHSVAGRRALLTALALVCLVLAAVPGASRAETRYDTLAKGPDFHSPFVAVADIVSPAVVAIRTTRNVSGDDDLEDMFRQFFPRDREFRHPDFEMPGAGSGFVLTPDGLVVTNNHVIEGAEEITVQLPGHAEDVPAEVVGTDPATDLALIRIEVDEQLAHLDFGDSDEIKVGDWAIAIGNPLGQLEGSLTVGVISAKGRSDLVIQGADLRYQDFLQTDAAINPGNSGGPLVNIKGEVIGVNTAINRAGQGIGFAIPARLASYIVGQLEEHGRVRRGYLGIRMEELTPELARARDLSVDQGVVVTEVLENTPAAEAGLLRGDVLLTYNGRRVKDIASLRFWVAESPVGSTARIEVLREGEKKELDVVLAEYDEAAVTAAVPTPEAPAQDDLWLGLQVASLSSLDPRVQDLIDRYDIRDEEGVLVVDVREGGPADEARLRPGDVIVEIVNTPISDLAAFEAAARLYADRSEPLAILVKRGEMTSYFTVDPTVGGAEGSDRP